MLALALGFGTPLGVGPLLCLGAGEALAEVERADMEAESHRLFLILIVSLRRYCRRMYSAGQCPGRLGDLQPGGELGAPLIRPRTEPQVRYVAGGGPGAEYRQLRV